MHFLMVADHMMALFTVSQKEMFCHLGSAVPGPGMFPKDIHMLEAWTPAGALLGASGTCEECSLVGGSQVIVGRPMKRKLGSLFLPSLCCLASIMGAAFVSVVLCLTIEHSQPTQPRTSEISHQNSISPLQVDLWYFRVTESCHRALDVRPSFWFPIQRTLT